MKAKSKPLRIDPIAEAKRQWGEHGWQEAAQGMALVTSVMRAHQLLLADIEQHLKPFGLSFARFELLRLLAFTRSGGMPMASVISRLQVHPASVTSAVERLSSAGLLTRETHPEDKRAAMLTLTPAGRKLVDQATATLNTHVFSALELSEDDQTALVAILARMRKAAGDFEDPRPYPEPL